MTYLAMKIIFLLKINKLMPCGKFFYCAMCHNLRPSLTIIMDDGDQYFEKNLISKNFHSITSQILMDDGDQYFEKNLISKNFHSITSQILIDG